MNVHKIKHSISFLFAAGLLGANLVANENGRRSAPRQTQSAPFGSAASTHGAPGRQCVRSWVGREAEKGLPLSCPLHLGQQSNLVILESRCVGKVTRPARGQRRRDQTSTPPSEEE